MLVGVVGLNGSGKDTVAIYLAEHYGFDYRDLGQEVREEVRGRNLNPLDRNVMVEIANEMRQRFGFDYWCRRVINSSKSNDLVITSLRNPAEIELIKSNGGTIFEVHAEQRMRFERTVERVRSDPSKHGDVGSFEDFVAKEERELTNADPAKQQLIKCIAMADMGLDNNGTLTSLHLQIDGAMAALRSGPVRGH